MAHQHRRKLPGTAVQKLLREAGIPVKKVVRKRQTGHYTADFFVPDMETPVPSSKDWAQSIQRRFPGRVRIIQASDTVATWREGAPTIHASVTFDFDDRADRAR